MKAWRVTKRTVEVKWTPKRSKNKPSEDLWWEEGGKLRGRANHKGV